MVEARMDPVRERYIHLIYLAILFMQPALEPGGPMDWLLAAALAAAFAVWYLTMPVMKSWYPWLAVAVAFAASFVNSGASVFYVYAGFMFGSLTTGRRLWRTLATVMAIVALQGAIIYFMYDSFFATFSHLISLVMLLFAGVVSIGEFERSEVNRRLRQANEQIATVSKIAERERIARDMHDVLGHTLSVVVLKSELAGRLFRDDPERAASEIRDVEKLARDALKEVRTSISGYRERGFQGELANVRLALEAADIELTENIEDIALETEVEQVLALVLREAVTNVLRHSAAHGCSVTLSSAPGHVTLAVADDGRGSRIIEGEGLRGMRERLQALGGHLELQAGEGMSLAATLPMGQAA